MKDSIYSRSRSPAWSLKAEWTVRADVDEFLSSSRWVDTYREFAGQLITGTRVGLKVEAALAGFTWRDDDPDGAESMVWYEQALAGDTEARSRLLTYNEDDVRATRALRERLTTSTFPLIADTTIARDLVLDGD